jgi:hypothetical protein
MKHLLLIFSSLLILGACGTPLSHQRTHKWNGRVEASAPKSSERNSSVNHSVRNSSAQEEHAECAHAETYEISLAEAEQNSVPAHVNILTMISLDDSWSSFKAFKKPKFSPKRSSLRELRASSYEDAQLSLDRELIVIIILFSVAILLSVLAGLLLSVSLVFWLFQVAASILALIALVLLIIYLIKFL